MRFRVQVTSAAEVLFAGRHDERRRSLQNGAWRIDIVEYARYVDEHLAPQSFGEGIETFRFGFEIGDLVAWGDWFQATRDYTSYRPKSKELVSVGQLEWRDVKDLSPADQLNRLNSALTDAIARVGEMKRKPRAFDRDAFSREVSAILADVPIDRVRANESVD